MIGRQQFDIEVTGADAANRALAESKRRFDDVGTAGQAAGPKLKTLEDGLEKVTGPAGKVLRVFNDVGDVFRLVTAGLAGGALFGGLQDIAEAMKSLADATGLTALSVEHLVRTGGVLDADMVKRSQGINDLADGMERYARSIGVAASAQLTFAEQQAGLRSIATGQTKTREGTQKEAEDLTQTLRDLESRLAAYNRAPEQFASEDVRLREHGGMRAAVTRGIAETRARLDELNRQELALLGRRGANPWVEAVQDMGREYAVRAGLLVKDVVRDVRGMAERGAESVREAFAKATPITGTAGRGRGASAPKEVSDAEVYSLIYGGRAGPAYQQPTPTMDEGPRSNIPGGRSFAAMQPPAPPQETINAWNALRESSVGALQGMATAATDFGGIITQALGTLTTAVGSMATNMIIAGEAGAKGVAKMAGNALAAASAQAYGYSVLLALMAAAAAASGPILGWGAGGLLTASGVMAGGATVLAVMARALGADKVGGAARAAGGGGGGSASAAGTNPYQPQGGGATQVTVIIGSEVVTRGVQTEVRKRDLRGGISEAV